MTDPRQPSRRVRSDAEKFLETLANVRCPCGHLDQRHRKATGEIEGEVFGACRDCECRGLIDWSDLDDDWEDEDRYGH